MGKVEQALPEADVMILRLRQGAPQRRARHDPACRAPPVSPCWLTPRGPDFESIAVPPC